MISTSSNSEAGSNHTDLTFAAGDTATPGMDEWGTGLVVISDGADTSSHSSLDGLIGRANELGVAIHAVGLGPASDSAEEFGQPEAVSQLRHLAAETGGFYGYVATPAELPKLAEHIAMAVCGGYQEVSVRFAEPRPSGERVEGRLGIANTGISVPFTFSVP